MGEQRRLKTYGMSKAHKDEGFDTNNTQVTAIEVVNPETGKVERILVDGRTRIGRVLLALWQELHPEQVLDVPSGRDSSSGVEVEGF